MTQTIIMKSLTGTTTFLSSGTSAKNTLDDGSGN